MAPRRWSSPPLRTSRIPTVSRCTAGSTLPRSILTCDKVLCGETESRTDVPKIHVIYTLDNTGPLTKVAPPCPKKGVIGESQEACVDYEQSMRRDGDLYLPFLFNVDARFQRVAQPANSGSGTRTTPSDPGRRALLFASWSASGSWSWRAIRAATASRNPRSCATVG